MSRKISIVLPTPPSVNQMYINAGRRMTGKTASPKYADWKIAAGELIHEQRGNWKIETGPCDLKMFIERKKVRADLSNFLKAVEDALVNEKIIKDDSLIQSIYVAWTTGIQLPSIEIDFRRPKGGLCEVFIIPRNQPND